jgi:hypothetical protein
MMSRFDEPRLVGQSRPSDRQDDDPKQGRSTTAAKSSSAPGQPTKLAIQAEILSLQAVEPPGHRLDRLTVHCVVPLLSG